MPRVTCRILFLHGLLPHRRGLLNITVRTCQSRYKTVLPTAMPRHHANARIDTRLQLSLLLSLLCQVMLRSGSAERSWLRFVSYGHAIVVCLPPIVCPCPRLPRYAWKHRIKILAYPFMDMLVLNSNTVCQGLNGPPRSSFVGAAQLFSNSVPTPLPTL